MIIGTPPFEFSVSAELITKLLPVSYSTACRWLSKREIPPMAMELLLLKLQGRVVPDSWQGFRFKNNRLWSETDYSFTKGELDQMHYIQGRSDAVNHHNKELMEYINYLESVKPRAPVLNFPYNRARQSLTDGRENNRLFNKPETKRPRPPLLTDD